MLLIREAKLLIREAKTNSCESASFGALDELDEVFEESDPGVSMVGSLRLQKSSLEEQRRSPLARQRNQQKQKESKIGCGDFLSHIRQMVMIRNTSVVLKVASIVIELQCTREQTSVCCVMSDKLMKYRRQFSHLVCQLVIRDSRTVLSLFSLH